MEPTTLRILAATVLFLCAFNIVRSSTPVFDKDEITKRIEEMDLVVEAHYNKAVELQVRKYLSGDGSLFRNILYRSAIYFPVFEKLLKEHGLPEDLMYLAVVESALNPRAMSPVGAGGLWQFMAGTGRNHGLVINKEVDERSCAYKSTEAAVAYLKRQHERYGSWELALAAYNCGAGNVNRAIQRARSTDYWKLYRYLPKETNNFVPAFIAVAYVANYYHLHGIKPVFPNLDLQITEAVKVHSQMDFETIASVTGIPVQMVAELNQAFRRNFVPEYTGGFNVLLPRRVATALREYLDLLRPENSRKGPMPELPPLVDSASYRPESFYVQSVYKVVEGDDIDKLAGLFSCTAYNLRVWNNLASSTLWPGQELTVWFSTETRHFLPQQEAVEPEKLMATGEEGTPQLTRALAIPPNIACLPISVRRSKNAATLSLSALMKKEQFAFRPGIHLHYRHDFEEVAARFDGLTIYDLFKWNGLAKSTMTAPSIKGAAAGEAADLEPLEVEAPAEVNIDELIEWDAMSRVAKPNERIRVVFRKR